ncbi:tRNA dihydrouridine synthase DusB [Geobacter sp. DSM 9736]|uniref:tRNA dihydrouridine synthase DusB n=1 Tax=Geobacter sp. DSM 9736 TaxID=1277350 RepID=UPI000B5013CD|nr:tRNA dihydrouridine synthase DusB [Geobacter sp. DSM 9736]SNB46705.1 tRNA-U20-dihydrouridine synthase [Geobacter sp. DSM 9736]
MTSKLRIGALTLANNLILAPMAGITNLPARLLARRYGASLCFTEMVSVNGLVREGRKTFDLLRSSPDDRPLGVQLFGDEPGILAEAARLVEGYADLVDINMGCPVKKVVGTGAGSALLREPKKVADILRAVRRATKLPLTIKIRTGWQAGQHTFHEIGRIAAEEGCDALTLHPRTRAQMFEGHADWELIRELKDAISIPIIGSGDIFSPHDVVAMLERTGCDGVMIARGGLGNPWIFKQAQALLEGREAHPPDARERLAVAQLHLDLFTELAGEPVAVREMRKHLAWYVKGLPGAAPFRAAANTIQTKDEMLAAMNSFFGRAS